MDVVTFSARRSASESWVRSSSASGTYLLGCVVSLLVYGLEQGQTADASALPTALPSLKVSARKRQRLETHSQVRAGGSVLRVWLSPSATHFLKYYENNGKIYICFESMRKGSPSYHLCFSLQILRKLKGLALDTETELERQDEALDGITAAVDRTT